MKSATTLAIFIVFSTLYLCPREAEARRYGVECALVEDGLVEVDGMIDDWAGIKGRRHGGADSGFEVRCAHTESTLFMAVSVRDDTIVRTSKRPKPSGQDRLTLSLGAPKPGSQVEVYPGTRGFEPIARWLGRAAKAPVQIVDSQQPDGWSVEVALPLSKISGWGRGTPKLEFAIAYGDADGGSKRSSAKMAGTIRFAGATNVYKSFMHQTKLRRGDIKVDKLVNLDGARGVERVIAGGNVIGVLTDEYRYVTLPVTSPSDVVQIKVVDLGGSGKSSIVAHYRQHGNGGSREVVAVWNLLPTGNFNRTLAFEVRKEMDGYLLANTWRLAPKKAKRGKRTVPGYDIVVEVAEVEGWDEDNYGETPAEDLRPILTPWGDQQSAVYHFEGDTYFGGEPLSR